MLTVANVNELEKKLSCLSFRKQFNEGTESIIRVLDYENSRRQKFLTLTACEHDPTQKQFGVYQFMTTEKLFETSDKVHVFMFTRKNPVVSFVERA